MAPEESLFFMEADRAGLHKATKGRALNLLTAGVPTLAFNFTGRRQVFVESEIDSKVYDRLYDLLKPKLDSERSLTFLSVGTRGKQGDLNSGCEQVKRVVRSLEEADNHSVYGLIDWDGINTPSTRIKVLAHGIRNGLEDCLYDPLLVACLIARDVPDRVEAISLKPRAGINQLKGLSSVRLQEIVNAVETLVLGIGTTPTIVCKYPGDLALKLSETYLELDDHTLEEKLVTALPALKKYAQRAGGLLLHLVDDVLPDFPEYIPLDFVDVFVQLLTTENE
jgi:hypothetical protein